MTGRSLVVSPLQISHKIGGKYTGRSRILAKMVPCLSLSSPTASSIVENNPNLNLFCKIPKRPLSSRVRISTNGAAMTRTSWISAMRRDNYGEDESKDEEELKAPKAQRKQAAKWVKARPYVDSEDNMEEASR